MPVSPEFKEFVLDQLAGVAFDERRMFGGVGLFSDGLMFAIISRADVLYFKTDEISVAAYEMLGANPFTFTRGGVERVMGGYYEVPVEVLDDAEQLAEWAETAQGVARRVDAAKPAGKRKRR